MSGNNGSSSYLIPAALAGIIGTLSLLFIIAWTLRSGSGHTSVSPYMGLFSFIPVLSVGICSRVAARKHPATVKWSYLAAVSGIAGILLLLYLDLSNTLLQYEVWIERGMP